MTRAPPACFWERFARRVIFRTNAATNSAARPASAWAFSIALVERLLRNGKLKHKDNAALDWEIGHAQVEPDRMGGASLIEPQRGDRQTVAGPASLLMALDAMAKAERFYKSELIIV